MGRVGAETLDRNDLVSMRIGHARQARAHCLTVHMDGARWAVLGIGTLVSFIVALGVVAWFMAWVRKRGFVPFAVYRILAGVAVLVWAWQQTR